MKYSYLSDNALSFFSFIGALIGFVLVFVYLDAISENQAIYEYKQSLKTKETTTITFSFYQSSKDCDEFRHNTEKSCHYLYFKELNKPIAVQNLLSFIEKSKTTISTVKFRDKTCIDSIDSYYEGKKIKIYGITPGSDIRQSDKCFTNLTVNINKDKK